MPTARGIPGGAWSANRLYAIGGLDNNGDPLGNVEAYDPETNTWQKRAPIPTPRSHPAVATLDDGQIIVAGGGPPSSETADVELYTPSSNTWRQLTAQKAQLCYGVENARAVHISPRLAGVVPSVNRCLEIVPERTTHYTILAEGFDGAFVTRFLTLVVEDAPDVGRGGLNVATLKWERLSPVRPR